MNARQLIARIRSSRIDDTVEPYLWSDEVLLGHIDDAVSQVVRRTRLLTDATTAAVTQITLTAGTAAYRLHSKVLAIKQAQIDQYEGTLALTTIKRHNRTRPGWWLDTDTSPPRYIIVDFADGTIRLDPIPDAAGTLRMIVWRMPLDNERIERLSDEPPIPEHMHEDLGDWVEHRCYSLADAETRDLNRAADAERRFTARFGPLPTHEAIRLWGVSPMRGTNAEFL